MKRFFLLMCTMLALFSIAFAESYTDEDGNAWTYEVMDDGNACITLLTVNSSAIESRYSTDETEDTEIEPEDAEPLTAVIPETINGIPVTAVQNLTNDKGKKSFSVEKLIIPSSVTSIESGFVSTSGALQTIEVDPDNPVYEFHDGFLIDKTTASVLLTLGASFDDVCTVPEGIRKIGSSAFTVSCSKIKQLILPSTLEILEDRSLSALEQLQELTLPDGLKIIGFRALPSSVIPFLEIPASVQAIESGALAIEIHLAPGNSEFIEQDGFILSADGTYLVDICDRSFSSHAKEISVPESVREIGPYALSYLSCSSMKLPDTLVSLGEYSFYSLDIYGSPLIIPGSVKTITENSVRNSPDIILSEGVEAIEKNAFSPAPRRSFTLPASLKKIDEKAFHFSIPRKSLADISFFTVPGSYAEEWIKAHGGTSKPIEAPAAESSPVESNTIVSNAEEITVIETAVQETIPAAAAANISSGICTGNQVNVRTKPSTNASSIGRINKGDSLIVLEKDGEWSKIECSIGVGYIKTQYIQVTQ